jgi:hypothetical protein
VRVSTLTNLAFVDEQRHSHHGAGLELGRLLAAGGGIPAQSRIGLDHLELDMRRRRHHDRHVVPQRDDADRAVLEPLRIVPDHGLGRGVLLEVVLDHEVKEIAVAVEVLHVDVGTSAASTLSPDLKVRSIVRPVLRLRIARD